MQELGSLGLRLQQCKTGCMSAQQDVMENTKLAMKKGMKRLNRAFAQSNSSHLIYLALFVVGLFCVVMFWTRVVRFLRIFI